MLDRPGKENRPAVPLAPPPPPELPESENRDFERRYGRPVVVVRSEMIRITSHARFLGRWSAP